MNLLPPSPSPSTTTTITSSKSSKFLKICKGGTLGTFSKIFKIFKNMQRGDPWKFFFCFLFNTLFYTRQPYKTIRMSFGGLRMLKSPKLTQCYPFASVYQTKKTNIALLTYRYKKKLPWEHGGRMQGSLCIWFSLKHSK